MPRAPRIQADGSVIIARCERAVVEMSPVTPPQKRSPGRGGNTITRGDGIHPALSRSNISNMRAAHRMPNAAFERVVAHADETLQPISRA